MSIRSELGAELQSQTSSPAPDNQSEWGEQEGTDRGEQHSEVTSRGEQNRGDQATGSNWVSKPGSLFSQGGEQVGEQILEGAIRRLIQGDERSGRRSFGIEDSVTYEHPSKGGERRGEQDQQSYESGGEQPFHTLQWLKSILPEASNGWWDVREKGTGMAIMFRWRDPNLQVITPMRLTSEQFETLKQSEYEEAKSSIREQISLRLHSLSLDPAKRDKAMVAAKKLGIDLTSQISA